MLTVEALESRDVPTAVLSDGILFVNVDTAGVKTHTVSVDLVDNFVQVNEDNQISQFNVNDVNKIVVKGDLNKENVIQNNTNIDSDLYGGNRKDVLFGGRGNNYLNGGNGKDIVYSLLGINTIDANKGGVDNVFTNYNAVVSADNKDSVVRFFGPNRTPGTPFIGFDDTLNDNVLYITTGDNGSFVQIDPVKGDKDAVDVTYNLFGSTPSQTIRFYNVTAISYFGGAGEDVYINNSSVGEAAYGGLGNGNDVLVGGFGDLSILKGLGGDDLLVNRAKKMGDTSGNAGSDIIFALAGKKNIIRQDNADIIFANPFSYNVFITP